MEEADVLLSLDSEEKEEQDPAAGRVLDRGIASGRLSDD
jgi:hypothetical protein